MMDLVKVKCPGYVGRADSMGCRVVQVACPELSRRRGIRPGTGKGYPEGWDRRCPRCNNDGGIYMELYQEVIDVPH